jgi:hypothetical protein
MPEVPSELQEAPIIFDSITVENPPVDELPSGDSSFSEPTDDDAGNEEEMPDETGESDENMIF